MDYVNKFTRGHNNTEDQQASNPQQAASEDSAASGGGGFLSKISNKLNSGLGGGPESEKNEDLLDKGIDLFQEKVLGQGQQDNESAVEQAKDEKISDFIRGQFKSITGKDIPIEDKDTRLD